MQIPFTLAPGAEAPARATEGSAGFDLTASEIIFEDESAIWYDTGVSVAIPPGFVGLLFARSSVTKRNMVLANGVGVIDSDYRGSMQVRFAKLPNAQTYDVGERIGQLVVVPYALAMVPTRVDELPETTRGTGGFGSTGN